ncbi:MAG: adenylate/guanylate cyclase domain-containing protein, partial [Alphaproteobacteria bacterium]
AQLVQRLRRLEAAAIGLDILFDMPDRMSPARFATTARGLDEETVASLEKLPSNDALFAKVLKRAPVVLARRAGPRNGARVEGQAPAKKTPVAMIGGDPRPYIRARYASLVPNLPELENAAAGRGVITPSLGPDRVVRWIDAVFQVGKDLHPAMPIEVLRVAGGKKAYAIKLDKNKNGIASVVVAGLQIPTDAQGRIWIRYSRHHASRYVSALDLFAGKVPPQRIAGKLVLVGSSALRFQDIQPTPLGYMPGVEIHAQLLETILAQDYLTRPGHLALGVELALTLGAGLLVIVLLPLIGARWTLLLLLVVVGGAAATSWYLFSGHGMLIDVSYGIVVTILIYGLLSYVGFTRTESQRREVRSAFGRYLSPALVEQLAADPERLRLGGETKEMTFLFCDVRGFTTIAERFKSDPEGLTRLINRFLTPMTDAILERGGTIDKYMGDCIMAFWNAPLDDEAHADHACAAALAMFEALGRLNLELEAEAEDKDFHPLRVGIGLNTGDCVVGNMGSEQRFDYSVLGDAVNLASRLEGQSKTYGADIVVGENTHAKMNGYATLELDLIAVKGKTEAVRIHALMGAEETLDDAHFRELEARHGEMLTAYRARDWHRALELGRHCRALNGGMGALYDLYRERIERFEREPPGADWDAVYVAETK